MDTSNDRLPFPKGRTIRRISLAFAAVSFLFLFMPDWNTRSKSLATASAQIEPDLPKTVPGPPTYPYSVVPGGIRSMADLRRAMNSSATIFNHFVGFDFQRATYTRVTGCYFISLLKDEIRWTKKCIWLHNEPAITDGNFVILTRCANRVAMRPKVPIEDVDVSSPLAIPVLPPEKPVETEISQLHDQPEPSTGSTTEKPPHRPVDPPSTCCGVLYPPHNPPHVRVPEPDTLTIAGLATLLSVVFAFYGKRSKRI